MKKNKSLFVARRKRRTFAQVFWKKWLMVMLVCGLISGIGYEAFAYRTMDQKLEEYDDRLNWVIKALNQSKEEDSEDLLNRVNLQCLISAENGFPTMIYDADTREILVDYEEKLFIFRSRTEERKAAMFPKSLSQIPGWEEYRKAVASLRKKNTYYFENVEMPYVYASEEDVIPGPFHVALSGITPLEAESSLWDLSDESFRPVLEWDFDGPEEVPEGYEKCMIGENKFRLTPLIVGYDFSGSRGSLSPCLEDSHKLLLNTFSEVQRTGVEDSKRWRSIEAIHRITFQSEQLPDGRKVTILCCMYYNVWTVYGKFIAIALGILFVLGNVIAFLLAKSTYAGMKAEYDMEDYRKNLMNTMAHDLKSPLMSISGYAENMEFAPNMDKQAHYAREIRENVQYMNRIIESVLELSKTEKGNLHLKKEKVVIQELFSEIQKRYELALAERQLQVKAEGELTCQADRGLMLQVLDNLLGNATKYATENSTVTLSLKPGIIQMINSCDTDLSEVVDSLCDPFVVGSKSRSGKTGSGMGLAIVKNICELHGYRLHVSCSGKQFIVQIQL